jgi:hypothetical protein
MDGGPRTKGGKASLCPPKKGPCPKCPKCPYYRLEIKLNKMSK